MSTELRAGCVPLVEGGNAGWCNPYVSSARQDRGVVSLNTRSAGEEPFRETGSGRLPQRNPPMARSMPDIIEVKGG